MIGAALLSKGLDGATKMVSSILMTHTHTQQRWADYYKAYTKPAYELAIPTASQQKLACDIERQFGYKFNSPKLLMSAFTHPSNPYSWEKVPSYQRLEFLGICSCFFAASCYADEEQATPCLIWHVYSTSLMPTRMRIPSGLRSTRWRWSQIDFLERSALFLVFIKGSERSVPN